jgi:hypothetical protein
MKAYDSAMRTRFLAIYWLVKASSSRIRLTIYSVAEDGQVKRLEEALGQRYARIDSGIENTMILSTYDIDRMLANRAELLWLMTHPSLRPLALKSYFLTVSPNPSGAEIEMSGILPKETRLAHSPENMDQFWIDDAYQVNRQDRSKLDRLREIRIVPH